MIESSPCYVPPQPKDRCLQLRSVQGTQGACGRKAWGWPITVQCTTSLHGRNLKSARRVLTLCTCSCTVPWVEAYHAQVKHTHQTETICHGGGECSSRLCIAYDAGLYPMASRVAAAYTNAMRGYRRSLLHSGRTSKVRSNNSLPETRQAREKWYHTDMSQRAAYAWRSLPFRSSP